MRVRPPWRGTWRTSAETGWTRSGQGPVDISEQEGRLPDHERHRAGRPGRCLRNPMRITSSDSGSPANTLSPGGCSRRCTASRYWTMRQYAGFGSAETRTSGTTTCSSPGRPGSPSPSISPPRWAATRTIPRAGRGGQGRRLHLLDPRHGGADGGDPARPGLDSMTINATAPILLRSTRRWASAACRSRSSPAPSRTTSSRSTSPAGPTSTRRESLRLITNMFAFSAKRFPQWNPISISGYHIREAGWTAAQEIAFTLADGIAYVEAALKAGWTSTSSPAGSRSSSTCTTTSSRRSPSSVRRAGCGRGS